MAKSLFDELKEIKTKLAQEEKAQKVVEDKKERETRLKDEFLAYMKNTDVKPPRKG